MLHFYQYTCYQDILYDECNNQNQKVNTRVSGCFFHLNAFLLHRLVVVLGLKLIIKEHIWRISVRCPTDFSFLIPSEINTTTLNIITLNSSFYIFKIDIASSIYALNIRRIGFAPLFCFCRLPGNHMLTTTNIDLSHISQMDEEKQDCFSSLFALLHCIIVVLFYMILFIQISGSFYIYAYQHRALKGRCIY